MTVGEAGFQHLFRLFVRHAVVQLLGTRAECPYLLLELINFEEPYSSDSYRGSFVAGITFLDKTRVGWWKNGFPHFYTRIPNAADWSRVSLRLIDEELDLAQWDVNSFSRRLDMKAGISYRDFEITSPKGHQIRVHVEHINNMAQPDLCLIKYSVTSIN